MRGRILLIVLAIVVLGLLGGLAYLGLNPPNPVSKPIEKTLPNDKFQAQLNGPGTGGIAIARLFWRCSRPSVARRAILCWRMIAT